MKFMEKAENPPIDNEVKKRNRYPPLSQRRKIALFITFCAGLELSYPTTLPLGLICASILIFQKNKKANLLGYLLILFQVLAIFVFINLTS